MSTGQQLLGAPSSGSSTAKTPMVPQTSTMQLVVWLSHYTSGLLAPIKLKFSPLNGNRKPLSLVVNCLSSKRESISPKYRDSGHKRWIQSRILPCSVPVEGGKITPIPPKLKSLSAANSS